MDELKRKRFQRLVDAFELKKPGAAPFDADLLDQQYDGASRGERVSIAFLVNVWNSSHEWRAGRFDVIDALGIWDEEKRKAFADWTADPFWP